MNLPGPLGAPFAPLYGLATYLRRLAYDRGWLTSQHAGVPTLSVGGLEVGGVGKTPITEWLLRGLTERGHSPGLLSRGYGRVERDLVVRAAGSGGSDPGKLGDEPAMLAAAVDVPMAISGDRVAGARALGGDVDCLVLDDGFAHRRLRRDLDIVVLRPKPTPDQLHLLPWGPLRESAAALRRAHVLWFHARGDESFEATDDFARLYAPDAAVVKSRAELQGHEPLVGKPAVLVTGVARPDQVRAALERRGLQIVETLDFPDHHRFAAADEAQVRRRLEAHSDAAAVVTAKDAVKMRDWTLPVAVIGLRIAPLSGGDRFWSLVETRVFPQQPPTDDDNFR